uniref:ALMS motif domain-containing protein n=1 Tax=Oryzias sinensis TaxID=183150 RepID=A0A8C8DWB8_9TELE
MCVCRLDPAIFMSNEFRLAHSPNDDLAGKVQEKREVQFVQHKLSYRERSVSLMTLFSSKTTYKSCIHHEVPLRSVSSMMFWDKSLCISLTELEGRRGVQPPLQRSALSIRFGVSACLRSTALKKPNNASRSWSSEKRCSLGHYRGSLSALCDHKEERAFTYGVKIKADDSDTQSLSSSSGLLSFQGPNTSRTKARREKRNADEPVSTPLHNFRPKLHSFNAGPESQTRSKDARSIKTDGEQGDGSSTKPQTASSLDVACHYFTQLKNDSVEAIPETLSLKEALELFRPDFISRSQGRVRELMQRAQRRKALQKSNPDLLQGFREDRGTQQRNCTTPDPLSDNLFKPKERSISGREMQLRSKRIYNKLPEVAKKKEEEKKRAESQTNRLRAEVFKKKLLDQILQR